MSKSTIYDTYFLGNIDMNQTFGNGKKHFAYEASAGHMEFDEELQAGDIAHLAVNTIQNSYKIPCTVVNIDENGKLTLISPEINDYNQIRLLQYANNSVPGTKDPEKALEDNPHL